jgi:hypothetical protein
VKLPKFLHRSHKMKTWKKVLLISVLSLLAVFVIFVMISISRLGELKDLGIGKITGFPGFREYLVVFQNDAERRPTGGFITAYGVLKFRFGIPSLSFGNVYDEKLIQKGTLPPNDIVASLIGGPQFPGHGFRDGNIDPDFPTTAEELIRLYQLGYPKADFDGVIAVDFTAFENLVEAVEPELIGSGGLFAEIEKQVQDIDLHNEESLADRKNFLGDLAKSLIKKIIFHPSLQDDAADSMVESLNSKHILLYFRDAELESRVEEKNWGGALPFTAGSDFLAINEGNYGGMKSSRYLVRDIEYDVEFQETEAGLEPIANLKVYIAHRGDNSEPTSGYYKGYWRIFAPLGSELISGKVDESYDDGFHQVWGRLVDMNPGEQRMISLQYRLPDFVLNEDIYNLELIKQPGSAEDHVRVTVKLPHGYLTQLATSNSQLSFDTRENLAIFETMLSEDLDLDLEIIPDTLPPHLSGQDFVGGINTVNLRFNEALDTSSVANAIFSIRDLDYRNKRTDPVQITSVRFLPPYDVQLDLTGTSEECREWYELSLDGVADQHGNVIADKKVTVVQWLNVAGENCDPENRL